MPVMVLSVLETMEKEIDGQRKQSQEMWSSCEREKLTVAGGPAPAA